MYATQGRPTLRPYSGAYFETKVKINSVRSVIAIIATKIKCDRTTKYCSSVYKQIRVQQVCRMISFLLSFIRSPLFFKGVNSCTHFLNCPESNFKSHPSKSGVLPILTQTSPYQ